MSYIRLLPTQEKRTILLAIGRPGRRLQQSLIRLTGITIAPLHFLIFREVNHEH